MCLQRVGQGDEAVAHAAHALLQRHDLGCRLRCPSCGSSMSVTARRELRLDSLESLSQSAMLVTACLELRLGLLESLRESEMLVASMIELDLSRCRCRAERLGLRVLSIHL